MLTFPPWRALPGFWKQFFSFHSQQKETPDEKSSYQEVAFHFKGGSVSLRLGLTSQRSWHFPVLPWRGTQPLTLDQSPDGLQDLPQKSRVSRRNYTGSLNCQCQDWSLNCPNTLWSVCVSEMKVQSALRARFRIQFQEKEKKKSNCSVVVVFPSASMHFKILALNK